MTASQIETLPDGREVQRLTLRGGGLSATVLTLGAIVQDLRLDGIDHPLVLGAPDAASYLGPTRYFGAIVGRLANRIGNARFTLDGRDYRTDANFRDRHTLHGGSDGVDVHVWRIEARTPSSVTLSLSLPDGHMGFPGTIALTTRIALEDGALSFVLGATTDAPTPCSLTHHGYFNLDGSGDVRNHSVHIDADHMLPTTDDLIPTGEIAPVAGTRFDFRAPRPLGPEPCDRCFCLSDGPRPLRPVAWITGESGLALRVETTACGLQFYNGAYLRDVPGLDGRIYGPQAGLALEAQAWPDAPNQPNFPSAILRPGEAWSETTRYVFTQP
ncbi:MAG: aldose epimerase family protein [Paracoccaceae bacterium]